MKLTIPAAIVFTLGLAGVALAQPSGGPDAKGNAPLKAPHTVNDGAAKPGANSFTEGQARQHILKSGYSVVSGLAKGSDGVWRGVATKNGTPINVALDFKGNVSEAGPASTAAPAPLRSTRTTTARAATAPPAGASAEQVATDTATTTSTAMTLRHHRHPHHQHHAVAGEKMDGQGAAISGVDRDANGISDKEDRALKH